MEDNPKEEETPLPERSEEKPLSLSLIFEEILEEVGGFGFWQWRMAFIASFFGIFFSISALSAAFVAATPGHRCLFSEATGNSSEEFLRNTTAWGKISERLFNASSCVRDVEGLDQRVLASIEGSSTKMKIAAGPEECHSWVYDASIFESTIVTEWDLVCSKKWLIPTEQATFMSGILVGGVVLSELSDMYGRRTISLISSVGYITTSICIAFSHHYGVFIFLRFMSASFISGVFLPNFVIFMETAGKDARNVLGILFQVMFSLGAAVLPIVAFFFRRWRDLQLALSVPSGIILLYFWFLPESPRWLLLNGYEGRAIAILRNIAETNKKVINEDKFKMLLSSMNTEKESHKSILQMVFVFFKNQATLFRTPVLRRRCLIMFFEWFTVSMVYYGLAFNAVNLDASIHLMMLISATCEVVALILCSWTVSRLGRRLNLCALFIFCGISCVMILAVPKELIWLNITLTSLGKFMDVAAFAVVFVYSVELVPTKVRNIAVGASSMWARIGGMVAPYIVHIMGDLHYTIPSTAFGVLAVLGGCLALLLPETGNRLLPESVEEIEALKR